MSQAEILKVAGNPIEKGYMRAGDQYMGPHANFEQSLPVGTLFEYWNYRGKWGSATLFFKPGSTHVDAIDGLPPGAVY